MLPTFINDRQTTVCQASIIWYYVLLRSISVQNKQTIGRLISFSCVFGLFFFFFKFSVVALWQACREVIFFRSRTCLSECIFKGPGKAWHYTCSCYASWRGIPSGTLLSGHVNCLFAYWIAPGVVLSSSENKQLITSLGQSGNLYANQENSQGLTIM